MPDTKADEKLRQLVNDIAEALTYAKEAYRQSRLLRDHDAEIAAHLLHSKAMLERALAQMNQFRVAWVKSEPKAS